jgi:predicted DNA-binding WGR domain protein
LRAVAQSINDQGGQPQITPRHTFGQTPIGGPQITGANCLLVACAAMDGWRRFERPGDAHTDFWQIRRDGIRCRVEWGRVGGQISGSTSVRDDDAHAVEHVKAKVRAQLRKGFIEVEPQPEPPAQATVPVRAALDAAAAAYRPVEGYPDVLVWNFDTPASGPKSEYFVVDDDNDRAVRFVVREAGSTAEMTRTFVDYVRTYRHLAFDGATHHKHALPHPIGALSHVLFRYPGFGGEAPSLKGRVGSAFPIHDCEIADADTEVLVDARTNGRDSLPYTDWARSPHPVSDLCFALHKAAESNGGWPQFWTESIKENTFKVYAPDSLLRLLACLADSTKDSFMEIRNYRGVMRRLSRTDLSAATPAEMTTFLTGISR